MTGSTVLPRVVRGLLVLVLGAGFGGLAAVEASGQAPVPEREPEQKLTVTASEENERGRFGFDVAISGDGTLALVGAPYERQRTVVRARRSWRCLELQPLAERMERTAP
jgi:hypothetical protein